MSSEYAAWPLQSCEPLRREEDRTITSPPTRPLLITIDGDGFIYRSRETGRLVGELILDEVLTAFPFKFTASVIAGDMERYSGEFDSALASRILALENVEAASHSWSHPHDWRTPGIDLDLEVEHSVRTIEEKLLPPGKLVKSFLWTGKCNPTAAALGAVARVGIANFNGGNPHKPYRRVAGYRHYASRAPNDWNLMGLEALVRGRKRPSGSVYDFLRSHDGPLDGFRSAISFFEANPNLPIHVYFHWYSAVRRDSLDALVYVLNWCASQDCSPLYVSEYISRLEDEVALRDARRGRGFMVPFRNRLDRLLRRRPKAEPLPEWWSPPTHEDSSRTGAEGPYSGVRRSAYFDAAQRAEEEKHRHTISETRLFPSGTRLAAHSTLSWSEHCVECAAPACYDACDMFVKSEVGCRRFARGIETTSEHSTLLGFSYRIAFLPWGNLLAPVTGSLEEYDGFLVEVFNPRDEPVPLVVDFRGPTEKDRLRLMVQERALSGENQFFYPLTLIDGFVPISGLAEVSVAPDTSDPETTLFFPVLEFVRFDDQESTSLDVSRIKCAAIDLDETLWHGILVEDGPEALEVNGSVVEQVRRLIEHGIVTSIVSRNDPEDARSVLADLGLADLFVFPQIGWGPKSASLKRLADSLRINVDAIVLVDDSIHEREEVVSTLRGAQAIEPAELRLLCNKLVSRPDRLAGAARDRVSYYRQEEVRQVEEIAHGGSHLAFLASLNARVDMGPPVDAEMDRVHELIQRTNRLNFSNHRYSREEVTALVADVDRFRCWRVSASDRFGDYGLIGFAIVDAADEDEWHIRDLMFSCRILGRHVDVFALTQILEDAKQSGVNVVTATFKPSGRNESAREALLQSGFSAGEGDSFRFDLETTRIPVIDYIQRTP